MKNTVLLSILLLLILMLPSCGDDASPSNSDRYLTAFVDGQTIDFKVNQCSIYQIASAAVFSIAGAKDESENNNDVIALIFNLPPDVSLTETSYQYENKECEYATEICGAISFGFVDENSDLQFNTNLENGSCTISFAKLDYRSEGSAEGTFFGTLYDLNGESISVSNGKFKMPIQ